MISCSRYHDFCAGHRVCGHENKCRNLHGHNYRVHFECVADELVADELDEIGRVIDFSMIKHKLCDWVEHYWDHKFLIWEDDDQRHGLLSYDSVILVPFNPTAENMALYLLNEICPKLLFGTGVKVITVHIEETRKCSATARIKDNEISS